MRWAIRNKIWLDARAQHRGGRTIRVTPPADAAPVAGRLSYREVLRRAAAAVAEAGSLAGGHPTNRP